MTSRMGMKIKNTTKMDDEDEDSDLADLLGNQASPAVPPSPSASSSSNKQHVQTQMNLDHVTKSPLNVVQDSPSSGGSNAKSFLTFPTPHYHMTFFDFIGSYISLLCHYYPAACGCMVIVISLSIMLLLANFVLNPVQEIGIVHDHSDITSKYDLSLGKVDHWCLRGGDDYCACDDPLTPIDRLDHKSWEQTAAANRQLVKQHVDQYRQNRNTRPDLCILGESVVEAMSGRWMGQTRTPAMSELQVLFKKQFQSLTVVPLGIAGDTSPNVLWRLLHGELPIGFEPRIWWVSVGMNDLARTECSEEVVYLGILRVVEEIMAQRPNAKVVINSLLPMGNMRGGPYPLLSDYQDAFIPAKAKRFGKKGDAEEAGEAGQALPQNEKQQKKPAEAVTAGEAGQALPQKEKQQKKPTVTAAVAEKQQKKPTATAAVAVDTKAPKKGGRKGKNGKDKRSLMEYRQSLQQRRFLKRRKYVDPAPNFVPITKEAAAVEEEEKARDRQFAKNKKPDPIDPVLNSGKKIRKYGLRKGTNRARLPLWTAIQAINKQLQLFAERQAKKGKHVYFYDATPIFVEKMQQRDRIRSDRITILGYPRQRGFELWEEAMVTYATGLLSSEPKNGVSAPSDTDLDDSSDLNNVNEDESAAGDDEDGGKDADSDAADKESP